MELAEAASGGSQRRSDFAVSVAIGAFMAVSTWAVTAVAELVAPSGRDPIPIAAILPAASIAVIFFQREKTDEVKNKLPWAVLSSFIGLVVAAAGCTFGNPWIGYSLIALGSSTATFGALPLMRATKARSPA